LSKISDSIYTVALTGGIASGKSSASRHFEHLGVPVVDSDLIAREVVQPGSPGLDSLIAEFGDVILDNGELDRAELRTLVFNDNSARERLESIVHPAIRERSIELVSEYAASEASYVICAVPLLVETGQQNRYHRIAVVDVSVDTQIARLLTRDSTTREQAEKILAAQASREERLAVADDVLDNEGTLESLQSQVEALHQRYLLESIKIGSDNNG